MGQDHARIVKSLDGAKVTVVVEPNQENLDLARKMLASDGVSYFSDLQEALRSDRVDGWIVSSSTYSHVEVTRALLRSGAKVLLEKPIAESIQSALELKDYVELESSNLMMGHILLWSEEFSSLLNRVVARGEIREIRAFRPRSASHRIDYPNESPFSLLMVHDLYCIQVLTRGVEPSSIQGSTFLHEKGGVDRAIGILEWPNGASAHAESNYLIPDDSEVKSEDYISVKGLDWEESVRYKGNFDLALRNELQHFMALLRGETKVPLGARYDDAIQIQRWVDTLMASAQQSISKGE
jgi:UDP-N-acetylglucosamine 3-dehydrogenase